MGRLALLAALAAALAATSASGAQAAASKAEFIAKGDALCTRMLRDLAPLRRRAEAAKRLPEYRQWAAVAGIWTDQIALQLRFNRNLRAIGAPPNDTKARALLAQLDRGVVLARRVRDAFANARIGDVARAVPAYVTFTLELNRKTVRYGFRVCGR